VPHAQGKGSPPRGLSIRRRLPMLVLDRKASLGAMERTREATATICRQDDADELLTRRFAGGPAQGGGRVVEVLTWGVEGSWFYRQHRLDLMVGYVDRGHTRTRERNPPWHPAVSPEELRTWYSDECMVPEARVCLWFEIETG
jgi:hypothetical protein